MPVSAINAGDLRNRLTIQVRTTIKDNTFGEDVAAWSDLVTVWGAVEPLSGSESLMVQPVPESTHRIRLRFRQSVSPRNRLVWRRWTMTAVAATDICTVASRTFQNGDRIRVASSATLPGGLAANTNYFVRDVSGQTFKLAKTLGGDPLDITSAGSGTHYAAERVFDVLQVLKTDEESTELVLACKEVS